MATGCTALLEGQKLFGTECLVVNLAGSFNEILQVCSRQEVSKGDELAMILILDIDNTPSVLTTSNLSSTNNNVLLTSNDSEWDDVLDGGVQRSLLIVKFIIVVRVHLEVVECELFLYTFLECASLFESKRVGFCDDWNDVYNVSQLLEDDDVNRLQSMSRWLNEEKAAMDAGILDISITLSSELLSEVC